MTRTTVRRDHPQWWVVALGLVLVMLGAGWWLAQESTPVAAPGTSQQSQAAGPVTTVPGSRLPEAAQAPVRIGDPDRLRIPELGVDSRVVPIRAPGGVLTPPSDPQLLGWWSDGARPGDRLGSSLVTGHTVSTGGGALDELEELSAGDDLRVVSGGRSLTYVVESTEVLGKGVLAEEAESLFDQSVPGRLVVITCEDWNGEEYLSNVVVTATPDDRAA